MKKAVSLLFFMLIITVESFSPRSFSVRQNRQPLQTAFVVVDDVSSSPYLVDMKGVKLSQLQGYHRNNNNNKNNNNNNNNNKI